MRNINDNEYPKDNRYGMASRNYNSFAPLMDRNIVCYKCNNLGHKARECKSDVSIIRREKQTTIWEATTIREKKRK